MLPSNLLRARVTKKSLVPSYVSPEQHAPLAMELIQIYKESVGLKKQTLLDKLSVIEEENQDYKLVRGLSALLERSCVYEARSPIDSRHARRTVFEIASKKFATTMEQVEKTLSEASSALTISLEDLEKSLWADLDDELILKEFVPPITPEELLKRYNLSLTQTSLFRSSRMEFTASGNWKNIFRSLKWLGLMYSIEKSPGDSSSPAFVQKVSINGPMSLFKMTDRYGTSLAKLLPAITKSDSWTIKAELMDRKKNRILYFEESSERLRGMISTRDDSGVSLFDSSVEEKFARKFNALGTNWTLAREPEPLAMIEEKTGKESVMIPDFAFELSQMKDGSQEGRKRTEVADTKKVYLEIVGFWTHEYMQRKLAKLSSIFLAQENYRQKVDLILAIDESLLCSGKFVQLAKLTNSSDHVILYKNGNVPLQPIVNYLESIEKSLEAEQVNKLKTSQIDLTGDIVSIEEIARSRFVSLEAAKSALSGVNFPGYSRVGNYFLSNSKAEEVKGKIEELLSSNNLGSSGAPVDNNSQYAKRGTSLEDIVALIESTGLPVSPNELLEVLGYTILWEGLDYSKSRVVREKQPVPSTATA